MKYVRFRDPAGYVRMGQWTTHGIKFGQNMYAVENVNVLPPTRPSKILCVGLNYTSHAEETGREIPERPLLFFKTPNTVVGHEATIALPRGKDRVDYEAELAVVIGKQCRDVSKKNAMEMVKGFTCMNDVSNRDDQREERNWVRGKAFDNAAPLGPIIATPEEVPEAAEIELRLNGEIKQEGARSDLAFSVPELISEITTYITLEVGDVIATGTPAGVGPLSGGDEVEIEIEGIGTLRHYVREE